jgi:hypothetical protein
VEEAQRKGFSTSENATDKPSCFMVVADEEKTIGADRVQQIFLW